MKTILNALSQMNTSTSLISKLLRRFLFTLLLPTVAAWVLYLLVLDNYITSNILDTQQTYLENSVSALMLSVSNADNVFSTLESMPEITYYLDVYPEKKEMLYSLVKYIRPQYDNLLFSNSSIESIRIYSPKSSLLYAPPFLFL